MIVVDDFEFQIKRHDQTVDMRPLLELAVVDHDVAANIIRYWLTLRRLAHMIVDTVEKSFNWADVVFRHARFALL